MVTVDQPIQQGLIASMNNEKSVCEDYIVVVSDVNLHFYSFLGQDILRALPFHGARVWALSPSLLIHVSYKSQSTSFSQCLNMLLRRIKHTLIPFICEKM